jgi:hypothetical protein
VREAVAEQAARDIAMFPEREPAIDDPFDPFDKLGVPPAGNEDKGFDDDDDDLDDIF